MISSLYIVWICAYVFLFECVALKIISLLENFQIFGMLFPTSNLTNAISELKTMIKNSPIQIAGLMLGFVLKQSQLSFDLFQEHLDGTDFEPCVTMGFSDGNQSE